VPLPEDLFLPVEGQMVAVFADQQLRQQAGSSQAVLGHPFGCRGDHRRQHALIAPHILGPDRFLPEELARLIIQLPADFLADALPVFGLYTYLKDVLERLPRTTNREVDQLTPLKWQQARQSALKLIFDSLKS
jgi:hypothetical protein